MKTATIEDLISIVNKFCEARDWDQFHGPKDLAVGLSIEVAELLEIFRFKDDNTSRNMMLSADVREKVSDELADIFFYLLRYSHLYGFNLGECLRRKLMKTGQRYPPESTQ